MSVVAEFKISKRPTPRVGRYWVHLGVAALLMVATLPGRTHGLGLFTEPILKSFALDRETYGVINLWATLLGSAFCLPCGWLMDRFGIRTIAIGVLLLLAAAVLGLSAYTGAELGLFIFILLTRGFGQSALSVGSLTLIGLSVSGRGGLAMAVYSCLISIGFIGAFGVLRAVVQANPDEWREPWAGIGFGVIGSAILSAVLIRPSAIESA